MDTIDKIVRVLIRNGFTKNQIEFHYDDERNIFGYITQEQVTSKNKKKILKNIWEMLAKYLTAQEFVRILGIFIESPAEKVNRVLENSANIQGHLSRFWIHYTKDSSHYWIFVDVIKNGDGYKSFYLIINEMYSYHKGMVFNYPDDIIKFMDLEVEQIAPELHTKALENAQNEIKIDLINRYEDLKRRENLFGDDNRFHYAFNNFWAEPVTFSLIQFTEGEMKLLEKASKYYSKFAIGEEINQAIVRSRIVLKQKEEMIF